MLYQPDILNSDRFQTKKTEIFIVTHMNIEVNSLLIVYFLLPVANTITTLLSSKEYLLVHMLHYTGTNWYFLLDTVREKQPKYYCKNYSDWDIMVPKCIII